MPREYGAVMYQCKFTSWNKVLNQIDEEDVYINAKDSIFGYEYEPHITLVYGFHEDINHEALVEDMSKFEPVEVELLRVNSFEQDEFDVLKIEVSKENLLKYRKMLLKKYDNTQEFDKYDPHITICYLKKGTAKKYHNNNLSTKITCNEIKYGSPKNHKIYVKL